MFPVIFRLGPFALNTYTLLVDIGIAVALFALYRAAPEGKRQTWLDAGIAATVGGFIGARLMYAMVNGDYYLAHIVEIFEVWRGGLAWPGAVLGGWLGAALYCSNKREPLPPIIDALALPIGLMGLLEWGGCLAASCAYGYEVKPGEIPQWMVMNAPDLYGLVMPRWPTQAAGVAWGLFTLAVVWETGRRRWPAGARGVYALSLTALGAFALAFTRGDPIPFVSGLRLDLVASGLILLITTLMWAALVSRKPNLQSPTSNLQPPTSNPQPPTSNPQ
jgi:phosphatidylglycerol:prolipoprotein diacylglycerol transferase